MHAFKKMIRQAFPGVVFPRNFVPFFPDKFLLPNEAREMVGGEKEFERLRKKYPDMIRTYYRGEGGKATKFSLYEVQDAIHQEKQDQRKKYLRER